MTTGCAGYGAALGAENCVLKSAEVRYDVRASRFGVGGFGVGLVRASMSKPYKSIGTSASCVAVYHSSGTLRLGASEDPFGPGFEPGDAVAVILRPSSSKGFDVVFEVNGEEVGVLRRTGLKARDSLSLAVQPYMGGIAVLT